MKATKVKSKKRGRTGWKYRFRIPGSGRITEKTFFVSDHRAADKRMADHLKRLEGGLSTKGWKTGYLELVSKFLKESPITSALRRHKLKVILERNELKLDTAAQLNDVGALTEKCCALHRNGKRSGAYLVNDLQPMLKQMASWGHEVGLLPENPLTRWSKLRIEFERSKRRSYSVEEVKAILEASHHLDEAFNRAFPATLVLKTLVVCGNRPGVVFGASIVDLQKDRLSLPPGRGKKRNGRATLPPSLVAELRSYAKRRKANEPLLLSPLGARIDSINFLKVYRQAATLAFVGMEWPKEDPATMYATPLEVALRIQSGRPFKHDGAPAKDPIKLGRRERQRAAIESLAATLGPIIAARLENRDLYAFTRKTHITLARGVAGIHPDAVNVQTGHSGNTVEEEFYLDESLVNPALSSQAVYDLVAAPKANIMDGQDAFQKLAAGAENFGTCEAVGEVIEEKRRNGRRGQSKGVAASAGRLEGNTGATSQIRTEDLCFTKALLYQLS